MKQREAAVRFVSCNHYLKSLRVFRLFAFVLWMNVTVFGPGGCARYFTDLNEFGMPISQGCGKVSSSLHEVVGIDSGSYVVVWDVNKRAWDGETIAKHAADYLINCDGYSDPINIYGQFTDDPEAIRKSSGFVPGFTAVMNEAAIFPVTKTIVCIDPIIVVVARSPWVSISSSTVRLRLVPEVTEGALFRLAYGFSYGSFIPSPTALSWYSPDLKQPPTLLASSTESVATLRVAWGVLHFDRVANGWQVRCETSVP